MVDVIPVATLSIYMGLASAMERISVFIDWV